MMLNASLILRRQSDVRFRLIAGEGVLIQQTTGEIVAVNEIGGRLVSLLDGQTTLENAYSEIGKEYGVPPSEVEADSAPFLTSLIEARILEDTDSQDE